MTAKRTKPIYGDQESRHAREYNVDAGKASEKQSYNL